jgi:hypothetical protein
MTNLLKEPGIGPHRFYDPITDDPLTCINTQGFRQRLICITVCNGKPQQDDHCTQGEPMTLKRIRLELARTSEFPNGSSLHGYEFTAPLDAKGHLDPEGWSRNKAACTVRRFWEKADDEAGTLIHRRDGKWAFSYRPGDEDDEPIFRFDTHKFVVGEYVSVTEHDGVERPFKVVDIHQVCAVRPS